jgi:hypothetical protein
MGRIKIGTCPRCNKGELFVDRDMYGWYECCLQCGYSRDLSELARPVEVKVVEEKGTKVKARPFSAKQ